MSRTSNDITLVCYDVTSNKLRRKIDKTMKNFGVRLQYSIFMCRLDADMVNVCHKKLLKIFNDFAYERKSGDSLIIIERTVIGKFNILIGDDALFDTADFKIF
ncbi:hypothetical protein AGMMS49975_08080 [Clostridia bacterium]|nr:hypothetical protein AGMMS49975_08080 [Clostridia bacterium]